jgi:hypothetical protein
MNACRSLRYISGVDTVNTRPTTQLPDGARSHRFHWFFLDTSSPRVANAIEADRKEVGSCYLGGSGNSVSTGLQNVWIGSSRASL